MTPAFKHYENILALKEGDYVKLSSEVQNLTATPGMTARLSRETTIRIEHVSQFGLTGLADVNSRLEECFIRQWDYGNVVILPQKPVVDDSYEANHPKEYTYDIYNKEGDFPDNDYYNYEEDGWDEGEETGDVGWDEVRKDGQMLEKKS